MKQVLLELEVNEEQRSKTLYDEDYLKEEFYGVLIIQKKRWLMLDDVSKVEENEDCEFCQPLIRQTHTRKSNTLPCRIYFEHFFGWPCSQSNIRSIFDERYISRCTAGKNWGME